MEEAWWRGDDGKEIDGTGEIMWEENGKGDE